MSASSTEHEHEFEAEYGLPEPLPAGEHILWQGGPRFLRVFLDVFHARGLVLWFALIVLMRLALQWSEGAGGGEMLGTLIGLVPVFTLSLALFAFMAWMVARTTVYTLTDRRVVMRIGIVLSLTFNLPLSRLVAADVRALFDGGGDICLSLGAEDKIAYLNLWPHARPWVWTQPQPALRSLAQVGPVATLLRDAWQACRAEATMAQDAPAAGALNASPLAEHHPA